MKPITPQHSSFEEQLTRAFHEQSVPEHKAHRRAVFQRLQEAVAVEHISYSERFRHWVRRRFLWVSVSASTLALAGILVVFFGAPVAEQYIAQRQGNTNSILDALAPQELLAESIQNTFAANDGIRHVMFHTVREDVNTDKTTSEAKEVTARTDQEYYIAPDAFTGFLHKTGPSVQQEKSYRMTKLSADTQSIENCVININMKNAQSIKSANAELSGENVCGLMGIEDYAGFAETQPALDIQDLSYNTDLDSEQMSFTTAEPIDPKQLGILIAEPSFVKYISEFIDAQNNIAFAPIALSPLGNVSGAIADPEWNVPVNGRYKQSFVYMLDGRYAHDTLTEATQTPVRIFSEVQLQFVQLNTALLEATTLQENGYDPKLFSAASQVFQIKFSDEWKLESVNALTQTPEDIAQFNARRLATRKEIFTNNSGETFFNYIAGGSAVFAQLHDVKPRVEGNEYVYSVQQEWNPDNPDMHMIGTTEVRVDSQTQLLTAIIERYDYPETQQATVYTTTFDALKTTTDNTDTFFSEKAWKERAKEIINDSRY